MLQLHCRLLLEADREGPGRLPFPSYCWIRRCDLEEEPSSLEKERNLRVPNQANMVDAATSQTSVSGSLRLSFGQYVASRCRDEESLALVLCAVCFECHLSTLSKSSDSGLRWSSHSAQESQFLKDLCTQRIMRTWSSYNEALSFPSLVDQSPSSPKLWTLVLREDQCFVTSHD